MGDRAADVRNAAMLDDMMAAIDEIAAQKRAEFFEVLRLVGDLPSLKQSMRCGSNSALRSSVN